MKYVCNMILLITLAFGLNGENVFRFSDYGWWLEDGYVVIGVWSNMSTMGESEVVRHEFYDNNRGSTVMRDLGFYVRYWLSDIKVYHIVYDDVDEGLEVGRGVVLLDRLNMYWFKNGGEVYVFCREVYAA